MSALTGDRNTPRRDGEVFEFGVGSGQVIWAGSMTLLDGEGVLVPAVPSVGGTVVGVALDRADNSAGSAGDVRARVSRGCFRFANSAGADEITIVDVGEDCYAVDDQTVALTDDEGDRVIAGRIADVDAHGVWVDFGL